MCNISKVFRDNDIFFLTFPSVGCVAIVNVQISRVKKKNVKHCFGFCSRIISHGLISCLERVVAGFIQLARTPIIVVNCNKFC